jgi:hypothetical protein
VGNGASFEWSHSRTNDHWQAIVSLLGQELTVRETEQLGVGPLENLLNHRFEQYVTLAFDESAQSAFFGGRTQLHLSFWMNSSSVWTCSIQSRSKEHFRLSADLSCACHERRV